MPWQLVAFSTQQLMYIIQGVLLYILKQNIFFFYKKDNSVKNLVIYRNNSKVWTLNLNSMEAISFTLDL